MSVKKEKREKIIKATSILFDSFYQPKGKVNFEQILDKNRQIVKIHVYAIDLEPGLHGFHIHQSGDLTKHCDSLCSHYNPTNSHHGGRTGKTRHIGDLGNIKANRKGIVRETFLQPNLDLLDVIGRSVIIHEDEDDLGLSSSENSLKTGNSGKRLLCGIIGIAESDCHIDL